MTRIVRVVALLAAGWAGMGATCNRQIVEPAFEVEDRRMVIIPLKDKLRHHFDSQRGIRLAELVTENLEARRKELGEEDCIDVVPQEELITELGKVPQDAKDIPHAEIGRRVKADLVLVGDIQEFTTRIPGDVGVFRGRAKLFYKVIDVARPEKTFHKGTISVAFPPERGVEGSGILMQGEGNEDSIDAGLMAQLVDELSKQFYVYEAEPHERKR